MPTLNYTTSVPVSRTIGEMQVLLAHHGADAVATRYDNGSAVGLSFTLGTPHGPRVFTLPVNVAGVLQLLQTPEVKRRGKSYTTQPQAERVAWRIAKDWLAAQIAIIEANMATLDQVMLPYLHVDGEKTLYVAYREREDALAIDTGRSS